jgi:hypothetical protein
MRMKALLYKELKLVINPMFYLVTLFSALLMIPQWLFFLALMYFCFISVPNLFTMGKNYKDIYFSATQPVRRRDIVKARVWSLTILELLQLLLAAVCILIRFRIYAIPNWFLDANFAFLGLCFVMYGIFNVVFLPMFYKTAYKVGWPSIVAMIAAIAFAAGIELGIVYNVPFMRFLDGIHTTTVHILTLAVGAAAFVGLNIAAYRISAARFEKIDL